MKLNKDVKIKIGSLGIICFKKGIYFYIGSAQRNFQARLRRHLSKIKKIFWHIDYLLSCNKIKIENIWINDKTKECKIAEWFKINKYDFIQKFGCSDCRCKSHLFFIKDSVDKIDNLLQKEGFRSEK